jgi:hypothetical protein
LLFKKTKLIKTKHYGTDQSIRHLRKFEIKFNQR